MLGYVVEVSTQGPGEPGEWKELTDRCKSTSYKVLGLDPQQEFCFRVRAYNAVGVSEPSPVSTAVRMEQKGEVTRVHDTTGEYLNTYKVVPTSFLCTLHRF